MARAIFVERQLPRTGECATTAEDPARPIRPANLRWTMLLFCLGLLPKLPNPSILRRLQPFFLIPRRLYTNHGEARRRTTPIWTQAPPLNLSGWRLKDVARHLDRSPPERLVPRRRRFAGACPGKRATDVLIDYTQQAATLRLPSRWYVGTTAADGPSDRRWHASRS